MNREYNKVETHPAGTTGRRTVMVPSEVAMVFLKANVLRKISLVRSMRGRVSLCLSS